MKKWVFFIISLVAVGIGALIYQSLRTDTDGYLELSEQFSLYNENQYENSNSLCMSQYYIAFLQENSTDKLFYLRKAEEHLSDLTEMQNWELSTIIERAIAVMLFSEGDYTASLSYYDKLIEKSETSTEDRAWFIYADANSVSGACLTFLNRVEEGEGRIKKAIEIYKEKDDGTLYYERALAHTFLAWAYANMVPPKREDALKEGITAFSYYKQRDAITNIDLEKMEELKIYLQAAYETMYPEKEPREFEIWFDENARVNARNYHFYTN